MYLHRSSTSASTDIASGIRVVIEPSQSAYFAGEPFSCTITFSNTHTTDPTPSGRSVSAFNLGHKRAAHSVSSAPMARPPTSPGTPKTAQPFLTRQNGRSDEEEPVRRRGLVGKPLLEKTRRYPARSLSVDISPQDFGKRFAEPDPPHSPPVRRSKSEKASPTTPHVSSPLARDHTSPVPPLHPHARKPSMITTETDISTQSLVSMPPTPTSPFQASLEPIIENGALEPPPKPLRHQSSLGIGSPPTLSTPAIPNTRSKSANVNPPHSAFATTFTPVPTELLLYAYAQLNGTLSIDPVSVSSSSEVLGIREALQKKAAIGGGSLDIGEGLHHTRPVSNGLFGFLSSPTPTSTTFPNNMSGATEDGEDALPTLETQPSMLAIDLSLAPGESRSYSYTLDLPVNLPPTFKGRAFRFSYELVVGICRASTPFAPSKHTERRRSRVMRVPIRVYNNVTVGQSPSPYDLLWPVARRREKAAVGRTDEVKKEKGVVKPRRSLTLSYGNSTHNGAVKATGSFEGVQAYAVRMLAGEAEFEPAESETISADSGSLSGCREAVEITTRNPKKMSYDVNKDGEKVAELTFVKSAYRLGETVLGVVEINEEQCRSKVFKMSAILEAHEILPWSSETVRRVHAEHHSNYVTDMRRVSFALDIPSDASPAFEVARGTSEHAGGLEWKLRLYLLVSVGATGSPPNTKGKGRAVEVRGLVRDGPAGEWGQSWRATVPMERRPHTTTLPSPSRKGLSAWSAIFSPFAGGTYHDADEQDEDEDGDDDWVEMGAETVECVVPLKVFPGNTAFRAMEVMFEV
ncbi:Rgp1-domain-containing protein [Hysterangium stoloniferum]|nr:Rgp1-domain-containing protein [Hysterangium stoloniferum]